MQGQAPNGDQLLLLAEPVARANSFVGTEEYLAPEVSHGCCIQLPQRISFYNSAQAVKGITTCMVVHYAQCLTLNTGCIEYYCMATSAGSL